MQTKAGGFKIEQVLYKTIIGLSMEKFDQIYIELVIEYKKAETKRRRSY